EFSLSRSKAVVLGKVTLVQRSGEKRGRGEATLKVEFQKWIIPPEAKGAALKQKPPKSVEIQTSWDGICLMPPQLPSAGERAIFFLAEWSDGRGVLTGYCSSPILAVAEEKVVIPAESAEEWGSKPILLRTFESKLKKLRKSP
ncbi:hypothetical protein EBZ37_15050, partial [bacterium]|nr:hypothetical protein [bacterium]